MSPAILRSAGADTLGQYAAVSQLLMFLSLLDFGFAAAFQRFVSQANGLSDLSKVRELIQSARVWLMGVDVTRSAACGMIAVGSANFGGGGWDGGVPVAFLTLSIWYLVRGFLSVYQFALNGLHGLAVVNYLATVSALSRLIVSILLLRWGFGLTALIFGIVIAEAVLGVGCLLAFRRSHKDLRTLSLRLSWKHIRPVVLFGIRSVPISFATLCIFQSDALITGYLLGAKSASVLYSMKMPVVLGCMAINNIMTAASPGLYELQAQRDTAGLRRAYRVMHRYNVMLSLTLAAGLILFHKDFIGFWVGSEQYGGFMLTFLLSLYAVSYTASNVNGQFVFARGDVAAFALVATVEAAAAVILSVTLATTFGLVGVIGGIFVSHAIGGSYLWATTLRGYFVGRGFFNEVMARPFYTVCAASIIIQAFRSCLGGVWVGYEMITFISICGFFLVRFVVAPEELAMMHSFLQKVVGRRGDRRR